MWTKRLGGAWLVAFCALAGLGAAGGNEARLMEAVKSGNKDAVRMLLKQPGAVNAPEPDGTTALHWAVRADDAATVDLLLRAGAKPDAANRYGVTPISLAAVNGNATIIQALLKAGANPNTPLAEGETVLMRAARTGNPEALKVLIDYGAEVNHRERSLGETALMWAAAENNAAAVRLLLDHGADANLRSMLTEFPKANAARTANALVSVVMPRGGWTALMYGARRGSTEAVRTLAERGADLNVVDPDGANALIYAIINAHYDAAAALLENGADPNVADSRGMAALYVAVDMHTLPWINARPAPKTLDKLDSLEIVKMLLVRGANPNATLKGRVLQKQHMAGDPSLAEGATPFMRAAKAGDVTVMRLLVEKGADPHLMQKNHTTALMMASGLGWRGPNASGADRGTEADAIEAIKLCLELGLDLNAFNDAGLTPMHMAVNRGDDVIKFLAERGGRLDIKDKQGRTPLDAALRGSPEEVRDSLVRATTAPLLRQLMANAATRTAPASQ
jgi:ankyrin repeat protein